MKTRRIEASDLLLVARRWQKRSRHTSVERFLDFFPGARTVTSRDAVARPYRLWKRLAAAARQDGYTSHAAGLEAAALWRILRHRPAVAHFLYADHDYHYFGRVARRWGCRTVGTFWFSIEEFERRMPHKSHLADLDLVIASGHEQQRYLERFVPAERVAFLPLGVDVDFFRPPAAASRNGPPRILQVGINRRDFATLRAVHRALRRERRDLELHMVGCPQAEEDFAGEDGVVFHPFLDDEGLRRVYQEATLLVLPLLEGGSSNALNEALAVGLPIVATRQPNLVDYVSPPSAELCPPGDVAAMSQACRRLLDDPAARRKASAASRRRAEQYGWEAIRSQLLELYHRHLGIEVIQREAS